MADVPPSSGISAAAHAYQVAMSAQQALNPNPVPAPIEGVAAPDSSNRDVVMNGVTFDNADSQVPGTGSANATSPAPPRTGTPVRRENGNDASSRAPSQHPEPSLTMPAEEAPPHGAPSRQYLNAKVTAVLLEGMKQLAKDQPRDPLRVLGEFLLQKSREIEG